MIALIVVIGVERPVVLVLHLLEAVISVLVPVVALESGPVIDTLEVVVPRNLEDLLAVQVEPNEALAVDGDVVWIFSKP